MSGGGNVFKGKQEYFYDLGEYGELWDNELDGLMNFLQKHLKVEPDDILVMDNQGEMEWQLDAKLKRVPNSQWAPGIKTLDSAEVKSAPGIVTFTAGPFHAVYFTKNSEKSFASIQFANEMSGGGKTEGNKWIKWSKSQVDAEIKIATKKFINVGPDGAYITEIHSNGTMSFSEPTSDLQKVISEVLEKKMSGGGNVPKKEKLASIVDKAFSDTTERIGQDNLKSGFYEWTSPKWIEGNVMTTSVDPTWVWADEDEDGEGIDGYWSISKEDVKKATDKLDTALKGQISKSSVIKKKSSGETWYDGDEEIEHFNYQVITTFKSAKGKKMSGGGNVPKGVMTLKEWIENTDLDEVGKYVKSKLKKPETQIYVIGEEDDYAVTIDTDWKEDKPLTDEEGSEHTLFIGKGVVEIDTDGAFTNTFFTKDANSTITKKYDEMSGGGYVTDWNGTKVTISKGDDPSRDITMLMEMSDTFGGLDIALSRLTKTYPIKSIKIDLKD